ncbi:MAG: MscL family protein [Acidimicrobiales bacterium]
MKGFKDFLLRGNLVTVAVGLVMALAFEAVVSAFVKAFITPAIGLASGGSGDFSASGFHVGKVLFPWGSFINAMITFVIVAAVVYFFIVVPFTGLLKRMGLFQDPASKPCPECLSNIPAAASRCSFCASVQPEPQVLPAPPDPGPAAETP